MVTHTMQADADRAWYEGEVGRRQAAQAAADAHKMQLQGRQKQAYQDLQAAAALRQKEAQLLEHRHSPAHCLTASCACYISAHAC